MNKEVSEVRAPACWVVDTPTRSLWLKLARRSEVEMTSSWSSSLTAAIASDVTTILTTFDLGGQSAVKNNVDFAVRLDRLRLALQANGSPTVWNLHASGRNIHNDDAWNSRGLMVCFNEVCVQCYKMRFNSFAINSPKVKTRRDENKHVGRKRQTATVFVHNCIGLVCRPTSRP